MCIKGWKWMKVDENGWQWMKVSTVLHASLMPLFQIRFRKWKLWVKTCIFKLSPFWRSSMSTFFEIWFILYNGHNPANSSIKIKDAFVLQLFFFSVKDGIWESRPDLVCWLLTLFGIFFGQSCEAFSASSAPQLSWQSKNVTVTSVLNDVIWHFNNTLIIL